MPILILPQQWRDFNKKKYPYFIHLKDREVFSLGGIYESWANRETGELHNTYSIVTTAVNNLMATIHNTKLRMPLILSPERERSKSNQGTNIKYNEAF